MRKALLLAALLASGCASSGWEKTERVSGGRLYVPKLYAPLLPGSIYPDKKAPVPTESRPAIVVVCPAAGGCREGEILEQAAQRGLVVLVTRRADATIAARLEVDAARTGILIVAAGSLKAEPSPSSPSRKIFLAALLDREPPEAGDATALRLYSPNQKGLLPNEAFRDAVEWLAGEIGAR